MGVGFFRRINIKQIPLQLDVKVFSSNEPIEEELWSAFLDSLIEKKILIDEKEIFSKHNTTEISNVTLSLFGKPIIIIQMIELLQKVGFQHFIVERDDTLDFSNFNELTIETVSSVKDISKSSSNIVIFIDSSADIRKARYLNEISISNGIPFLSLRIYASSFELGPLALPGQSACFECYWQRLQSNSDNTTEWYLDHLSENINLPKSAEVILNQNIALQYLTMECLRFSLQEKVPISLGHIISHDFDKGRLRSSSILEVPGCEICNVAGGIYNEATIYGC